MASPQPRQASTADKLPPISEAQFLDQVTAYATLKGWSYLHLRPARTANGWRTAVSGPLGKGWVDLVLVRGRDHRLLFVELKADGGRTTPEQHEVALILGTVGPYYCWHPADWPVVEVVLA